MYSVQCVCVCVLPTTWKELGWKGEGVSFSLLLLFFLPPFTRTWEVDNVIVIDTAVGGGLTGLKVK